MVLACDSAELCLTDGLLCVDSATHKWIDPEGLIAKDREKRLAEKAKEQA